MHISGMGRERDGRSARVWTTARAAAAGTAVAALAFTLTACGGGDGGGSAAGGHGGKRQAGHRTAAQPADPTRIPQVGDGLQKKIPDSARQVVAVYGKGRNSADATVRLYTRSEAGGRWTEQHSWAAHNGKKGWTLAHHEGDKRSPVGVFSLTDAGGVLPAPDAKLPYSQTAAFTPPSYWAKSTRHDFDHVIAIDYNRVKGTSPLDPQRPMGQARGGSIWLHMDHGSGTSGCVSLSKSGMEYLLRTLSPQRHPVVVMGDRADLAR